MYCFSLCYFYVLVPGMRIVPHALSVAVHYQSVSGIIFSGRLESLSLLPEQGEEVMKVQLQLARSKINALVIKEIYYVGCKGELGADYQADQYVTLYNNSDET